MLKNIGRFIKDNYKFLIGVIVGLLLSGTGVYAANTIYSKNVTYDNSSSGLTSVNVQDALDETYDKLLKFNINLNSDNATTSGTSILYMKYGSGIYLDSGYTKKMTTSANSITVPTRTGYTFKGYYEGFSHKVYLENIGSSNVSRWIFYCDDYYCYDANGNYGDVYIYYSADYIFDSVDGVYELVNPGSVNLEEAYGNNTFNSKFVCLSGYGRVVHNLKKCANMFYVVSFSHEKCDDVNNCDQYYVGKNYTITSTTMVTYGTKLIDSNGRITSSFSNNYFNNSATLYARWS